jgi:hypothetical protein
MSRILTVTTLIIAFHLSLSSKGFAQTRSSIIGSSQSQGQSITQTANISGNGGMVIQGRDHIVRQQPNKVNVAISQSVTLLQVGDGKSKANDRNVPIRGGVNRGNVIQQAPKVGTISDTKTSMVMTSGNAQISNRNGITTLRAVGVGIAIGMGKTSASSGSTATIVNGVPSASAFGTASIGR